jgi:hypothetical protein
VEFLALSANEETISIQPAFVSHKNIPNAAMVPVANASANLRRTKPRQPPVIRVILLVGVIYFSLIACDYDFMN